MTKYRMIAVALVVAAFSMANAQTPEYVPVAKTPELGKAPGLRVQLLTKPGEEPREYALIFGKGDEVASGLWSSRSSMASPVHTLRV